VLHKETGSGTGRRSRALGDIAVKEGKVVVDMDVEVAAGETCTSSPWVALY
jgi:hypothetical protein